MKTQQIRIRSSRCLDDTVLAVWPVLHGNGSGVDRLLNDHVHLPWGEEHHEIKGTLPDHFSPTGREEEVG